jgi:predicted metal-binding membrane protein
MPYARQETLRACRLAVFGGIASLVVLSWIYTVLMPGMDRTMAEMAAVAAAGWRPWTAVEAVFTVLMWLAMMVAMMTPSALPMLLVFDRIASAQRSPASRATLAFLFGYLALWVGFSVVATAVQGALHAAALLSPGMESVSPLFDGIVLLAAGAYQLSPLKQACLAQCRSPLAFVLSEWREGTRGAFVMGLRHGVFCLGCCWVLMALLFVGGVMDLLWIGGLAAVVLLEKVSPVSRISTLLGIGLLAWGAGLLLAA